MSNWCASVWDTRKLNVLPTKLSSIVIISINWLTEDTSRSSISFTMTLAAENVFFFFCILTHGASLSDTTLSWIIGIGSPNIWVTYWLWLSLPHDSLERRVSKQGFLFFKECYLKGCMERNEACVMQNSFTGAVTMENVKPAFIVSYWNLTCA